MKEDIYSLLDVDSNALFLSIIHILLSAIVPATLLLVLIKLFQGITRWS